VYSNANTVSNRLQNDANCTIPPGFHRCPNCHALVSNERRELLGTEACIDCTPQKKRPIGAWDYPEGFHERNEGVGGLVILD
jgi:hypothetical protein